jgi:hypothetical protein
MLTGCHLQGAACGDLEVEVELILVLPGKGCRGMSIDKNVGASL